MIHPRWNRRPGETKRREEIEPCASFSFVYSTESMFEARRQHIAFLRISHMLLLRVFLSSARFVDIIPLGGICIYVYEPYA